MRDLVKDSNAICSVQLACKTITLFQPSPVLELHKVTFEADGDKSVSYADDIYLLLNQRRLDKLIGTDSFNNWVTSMMPKSDSLAQLRSKCTDEQLMAICKSRYIQSPSQLLAWSEYLNANYGAIVDSLNAPEPAPESAPEPAPTE